MAIKMWSTGVNIGDAIDLGGDICTKYGALLTKLDVDTGDTTWATTYALTSSIMSQTVKPICFGDADLYAWMLDYQTKFNGLLAALDGDDGVADVNYASLWTLGTLIGGTPNTKNNIQTNGMNQGDILYFLNKIIVNMAGLNAKLDLDGTLTDVNYATLCNITDVIDESGC